LDKNDFFYFAQFPVNFGWFVQLLIGYCEPQLTKNHKALSRLPLFLPEGSSLLPANPIWLIATPNRVKRFPSSRSDLAGVQYSEMMSHIDAWATLAAMVGLTLDMTKRNDSEAFQSFLVKSRANATTEFERPSHRIL
jgi:hypothetical protein